MRPLPVAEEESSVWIHDSSTEALSPVFPLAGFSTLLATVSSLSSFSCLHCALSLVLPRSLHRIVARGSEQDPCSKLWSGETSCGTLVLRTELPLEETREGASLWVPYSGQAQAPKGSEPCSKLSLYQQVQLWSAGLWSAGLRYSNM